LRSNCTPQTYYCDLPVMPKELASCTMIGKKQGLPKQFQRKIGHDLRSSREFKCATIVQPKRTTSWLNAIEGPGSGPCGAATQMFNKKEERETDRVESGSENGSRMGTLRDEAKRRAQDPDSPKKRGTYGISSEKEKLHTKPRNRTPSRRAIQITSWGGAEPRIG